MWCRGWFELWNLVFMQFDRQPDGTLVDLPAPSVDTGAGLERLAVAAQGVLNNYDIDLLRPLAELAGEIAGKRYQGTPGDDDVSMRVIADHARLTAFLLSENISPGNDGRPYVLRRVMRRAIRHGHRLGIEEPFLHHVALKVADTMGDAYPQLVEQRDLIAQQAQAEEEAFRRTLKRGLELLERNDEWRDEGGRRVLPGAVAFKLYDTFGFPVDLQDVIGAEQDFTVDHDGFQDELAKAKERSSQGKLHSGVETTPEVYYRVARELGEVVAFGGYEAEESRTEIATLIVGGETVEAATEGDLVEVVTKVTPFYGEKGGQVGDRGVIRTETAVIRVDDTQIPVEGLVVHKGVVEGGRVTKGEAATLTVDHEVRNATRRNHSATHLLHGALREVVGPTAVQKGSLVGPDRLRFDYAATRPLTQDEIRRIEDLVNHAILENTPVLTEVLPMDEAKSRGAIGIFEEKYGDVVRMLRIGPTLELCGGTHALRTGDLGMFTILGETGISAGVRRIEAATGLNALAHLRQVEDALGETAALVKARPLEARDKVERLVAQQKELQREIDRLNKKLMSGGSQDLTADAKDVGGMRVLGATVELGDAKALRELADQLRDKLAPAVILLGSASPDGKKALLVCSVSKEITDRVRAGDVVKKAAAVVGGGGGGRPDFAQAGGSDPSKLGDAVSQVYAIVGA